MLVPRTLAMLLASTLLLHSQAASACQPCPKVLSLAETVQKADLVIVGKNLTKRTQPDTEPGGPDEIDVWIIRTLLGEETKKTIRVNSWDGMCPYGIVADGGHNVMLLKRQQDKYDAVESGCSVKTYPVKNGIVDVEGTEMSLQNFTALVEQYKSN